MILELVGWNERGYCTYYTDNEKVHGRVELFDNLYWNFEKV
jgi:hypothetical protein